MSSGKDIFFGQDTMGFKVISHVGHRIAGIFVACSEIVIRQKIASDKQMGYVVVIKTTANPEILSHLLLY